MKSYPRIKSDKMNILLSIFLKIKSVNLIKNSIHHHYQERRLFLILLRTHHLKQICFLSFLFFLLSQSPHIGPQFSDFYLLLLFHHCLIFIIFSSILDLIFSSQDRQEHLKICSDSTDRHYKNLPSLALPFFPHVSPKSIFLFIP